MVGQREGHLDVLVLVRPLAGTLRIPLSQRGRTVDGVCADHGRIEAETVPACGRA